MSFGEYYNINILDENISVFMFCYMWYSICVCEKDDDICNGDALQMTSVLPQVFYIAVMLQFLWFFIKATLEKKVSDQNLDSDPYT